MTTVTPETENKQLPCISYWCATHVGMRREENQDSYGVLENDLFKFYIVADGMGGVQGGAIASSLAVDVVKAFLADRKEISRGDIIGAVGAANHAIFEKGMEQPSLAGMGTTFVGLCFFAGNLFVINVGDSRAYIVRGESIGQLTEDHTLISELLKSGAITEEQVENHPVAHMLTRSLGPTEEIEVDCMPVAGAPVAGDKFVLCSDGLYNHVDQHEIGEVVFSLPAEQAAEQLISLANERGGSDNITVMVVEIGEDYVEGASDLDDTMELGRAVHVDTDGEGELTTTLDAKSEEHGMGLDVGDVDTLEGLPVLNGTATNGAGNEETGTGSPEISPTVGGVSQERLIKQAMAQADGIQSTVEMQNVLAANQSNNLVKFAIVTVCVAFGTFAALYWNAQSSAKKMAVQSKEQAHKEANAAVPAVDSKVFESVATSPITTSAESDDTDAKVVQETTDGDSKTATVAAAVSKDEPTSSTEKSESKELAVVQVEEKQTVREKPSIIAKMDQIKQQIVELEKKETLVSKRLESFSKPLSGSSGILLADATRALDEIKKESDAALDQLEDTTKKLSIWYGQKQRLKSTQILKIASEVAPLSEEVAAQKKKFEDVTWQFLKKREELQYSPEDEKLQVKVDSLVERRKEELKVLNSTVRKAIEQEMEALDGTIAELTLAKEALDVRAVAASEELEYVQALMSQDPKKQAATKQRLQQQLNEVLTEKESLQTLFASLYDEVANIDPQ